MVRPRAVGRAGRRRQAGPRGWRPARAALLLRPPGRKPLRRRAALPRGARDRHARGPARRPPRGSSVAPARRAERCDDDDPVRAVGAALARGLRPAPAPARVRDGDPLDRLPRARAPGRRASARSGHGAPRSATDALLSGRWCRCILISRWQAGSSGSRSCASSREPVHRSSRSAWWSGSPCSRPRVMRPRSTTPPSRSRVRIAPGRPSSWCSSPTCTCAGAVPTPRLLRWCAG